ncbi:unknown [Clostridium sp. CAG:1024]|nr:unknown [Clostridium sp. CAG:1024]
MLHLLREQRDAILTFLVGERGFVRFCFGGDHELFVDGLFHTLRGNAVRFVIGLLLCAAPVRFVNGALHGRRDLVRVHDDAALDVACGAADRLHKAGGRAEKALLVRIENGDEADLRQIESLAQQVDADQHVELAEPQVADNLHALQRVDV